MWGVPMSCLKNVNTKKSFCVLSCETVPYSLTPVIFVWLSWAPTNVGVFTYSEKHTFFWTFLLLCLCPPLRPYKGIAELLKVKENEAGPAALTPISIKQSPHMCPFIIHVGWV